MGTYCHIKDSSAVLMLADSWTMSRCCCLKLHIVSALSKIILSWKSPVTHNGDIKSVLRSCLKMVLNISSLKHVFSYRMIESRLLAGELPPTRSNRLQIQPLKYSHQASRAHVLHEAKPAGFWLDLAHLSYLIVDNNWCSCWVCLSMTCKFLMST